MRRPLAVAVLALVALASGCTTYPGRDKPTDTVKTYIIALHKGDHRTAYNCMTEEFREGLTFEEFSTRNFTPYKFMLPREEDYGVQDLQLREDRALVTYYIGRFTVLQPVVKVNGRWLLPEFGTLDRR